MANEPSQKFPSTAHYDERGNYIPCPLNQPYAYDDAEGRTGAHDRGQQEHPFPKPDMNG